LQVFVGRREDIRPALMPAQNETAHSVVIALHR
jgi:hypothetical protein